MINVGVLQAILRLKDQMSPAIAKARGAIDKASGGIRKAFGAIASTANILVAGAAATAFVIFARSAAAAASRAQETQNLFDVSFGDMADKAEEWAQRTQQAIGVNDTTLKEFAGTLFNMTSSMGVARGVAFDLSTGFAQLAIDASSFFNISFERSFQVIQAGLAGEVEGLRRLGIDITETSIKQLDFVKAIEATGRELSANEKIQARAVAIIDGMSNAQGDLIRTQNSWANQTRLVGETWTNLLEVVGEFITDSPQVASVLTAITTALQDLATWIEGNRDAINNLIAQGFQSLLQGIPKLIQGLALLSEGFGAATTGIGSLINAFGRLAMFMMEQTPIFKALGFVMPELTANMRESAASMAEVGDSIALSGGKAFAMGQTLRDAAVNVGTALDEIIAGMGKQGEVTEETETMVEKYKKQLQELRQALIDATKGTGDHEKELKKQSAALSKAASETAKAREEVERVATAHERLKQQIELSAGPQEVQRQNWIDMSGLTDQLTRNLETTTHQLDMYAHNTGKSEKETIDLSRAIENLDHLFSAFGINANSAMGGVLRDFSLLNESLPAIAGQTDGIFGNDSLSKMQKYQAAAGGIAQGIAGIAKATASGSTGSRAARGALAGAAAGGQFGPIGAAVGAGVGALTGFLRGRAVDKFEDTLKREMEFSVSRGLAEAVKASGEKWQLSLGAMLQEGVDTLQIGGDDVAREIGDLFSMFERGELSEGEIFESLRGAIPVLLQNLENLGEGGEAEVDRIIAAAQRMGIEFEGLSELINSTFAPQTLEEMKESLGLTGEEVRALAEKLGVDLQTNLERSAQQMGLTVDELKALQDAAGQALGSEGAASMEELQALMDAMGLSAQDLADKLGLEIPGGAGSLADEAAKGKTEISLAADEALRLKDNLISAANAANGINIPSGGPGPGSDIPAFAHGGFVPETFPSGKIVRVAEPGTGGEYMTPAKGGGGTSNVSNVTINVQVQGSDEQAAHKIGLLLERDKAGLRRRTRKALGL